MSFALQFFLFAFLDRDHEYEGEQNEHTHACDERGGRYTYLHTDTRTLTSNKRNGIAQTIKNMCVIFVRCCCTDIFRVICQSDVKKQMGDPINAGPFG